MNDDVLHAIECECQECLDKWALEINRVISLSDGIDPPDHIPTIDYFDSTPEEYNSLFNYFPNKEIKE